MPVYVQTNKNTKKTIIHFTIIILVSQ